MKIELELDDDFCEDGFLSVALAAVSAIQSVMKMGHIQRMEAGKPTDEWMKLPASHCFDHAFVHLLNAKSTQNPCAALTTDTALTERNHSLCRLAMVECHEGGFLDNPTEISLEIDTTEDELKGE